MKKINEYLWLIKINLIIATFTFGGGYIVMPMIRKYYVNRYFSEADLVKMTAIAQSSPGAIAINLSVLAGKKAAGKSGLVIALVCGLLPPLVIIAIISQFYTAFAQNPTVNAVLTGMQAAVAALLVEVVWDLITAIRSEKNLLLLIISGFSFIANAFFNLNVVVLLVSACLVCVYKKRKELFQ